jgi:ATP-dependent DNA helicase RecQ
MKGTDRKALTNMLYQLVDGGLLERTAGDRPVLKLNQASWTVMRGQRDVQLLQPKIKVRKSRVDEESWEGVDRGLFETLRKLRREIASDRGVPPFVLFSDATLRDMARVRPGSSKALLRIRGIGERKSADLGTQFLEAIASYCDERGLSLDLSNDDVRGSRKDQPKSRRSNEAKEIAFDMFSRGESIERVAEKTERAPSTVCGYLVEFIHSRHAQQISPWVDEETMRKVEDAAGNLGTVYLKPIYERLDQKVSYDHIRIVIAHLSRMAAAG